MNPSLGETSTISFVPSFSGRLRISVLDRDRYPVRSWYKSVESNRRVELIWDGTDGIEILPDEAYTFRIDMLDKDKAVYDPTLNFKPVYDRSPARTYSSMSGTLSYVLKAPSRVHIQAGLARKDPTTQKMEGCVIATLVDRQPRPAGSVVEFWDGFDATQKIYLPHEQYFVMAIIGASMPENTVILTGNKKITFLDYVRTHPRPSTMEASNHPGAHHEGLNSIQDQDPKIRAVLSIQKMRDGMYELANEPFNIRVSVDPQFSFFLTNPNELQVFIDEKLVDSKKNPGSPVDIMIGSGSIPGGRHILTVNWISEFGPVGISSFLISRSDENVRGAQ